VPVVLGTGVELVDIVDAFRGEPVRVVIECPASLWMGMTAPF
jgi:hypothetical protein